MDLLAKSRFTSWISVIFSSTELAQMNLITRTFASGTTDELTAFWQIVEEVNRDVVTIGQGGQ